MLYCNSVDQCRLIFLYKLFITPINKNHIQSIVFCMTELHGETLVEGRGGGGRMSDR